MKDPNAAERAQADMLAKSQPTRVRNSRLAAVLSIFGFAPRKKDPCVWYMDDQNKEHAIWYVPKLALTTIIPKLGGKAKRSTPITTGLVCEWWETCKGSTGDLEDTIQEAKRLAAGNAELLAALERIEVLQYVSQVEACQLAFEEYQGLMPILREQKRRNPLMVEHRDNKMAFYPATHSEEQVRAIKERGGF